MEETLKKVAESGDVEALYSLLSADPYVLDRIDKISFGDNPLHIAAAAGNVHFAMEIATLRPSLARKLNHLGLSPVHVALRNGHDQLVRALITIDSEFVRVKAKGRITPLHYVAQVEDVDLLADFLSICPSSIEDLTVQCENVVHLAIKNHRDRAFKVLLGWLTRANQEGILEWKDEDGNTTLHIATSTNQPEVMKLVIPNVNVNAKNFSGLTAMDIFNLQRDSLDSEVGHILRRAKAKTASELSGSTITFADYLRRDLSLIEIRDKRLGIVGQSQEKSADIRNIVLVVATLIATAAYQAALSPPGGYWQEESPPGTEQNINSITNTTDSITNTTYSMTNTTHRAGKMILGSDSALFIFFLFNTLAFYTSLVIILIVIIGLPYFGALLPSMTFLIYAYYTSVAWTFPPPKNSWYGTATSAYIIIMYILAVCASVIPYIESIKYKKFKHQVVKSRQGG